MIFFHLSLNRYLTNLVSGVEYKYYNIAIDR